MVKLNTIGVTLWLFLFVFRETSGFPFTIAVNHACADEILITKYEACLEAYRIARENPSPFFILSFEDACAGGISSCFHDTLNDLYNCTYNQETLETSCGCPNEGVAWTEGRINSSYVPGLTCNDIDECEMGTDLCDPLRALCSNTQGSYICECKDGYVAVGDHACVLTEEACLVLPDITCSPDASCQSLTREQGCYDASDNLPNRAPDLASSSMTAFKCMKFCYDAGNAYAAITGGTDCYCTDVMPTNQQSPTNCDISCGPTENEICGNTAKTFASYYLLGSGQQCVCNEGFIGNGTSCIQVDNCEGVEIPPNARCTNLQNTYEITCEDGYIMDSNGDCVVPNVLSCDEIDSSETDDVYKRKEAWAPDCSRVQFTNCNGTGGGHVVFDQICCGEVEEVTSGNVAGTSNCTNGSLVGHFNIKSITARNFRSNQSWSMLTPVIECGQSQFSVTVDRVILNAYGYSLSSMALGDFPLDMDPANYPDECRGRRYADAYGPRYIFDHDFSDKCGVKRNVVSDSEEIMTFTLSGIKGFTTALLLKRATIKFSMSCVYNTRAVISSDESFRVIENLKRKRRDLSALGQLTLHTKSDATFSSALQTNQVLTKGDPVYLEVYLPNLVDNYALQWLQCWQSDSVDPKTGKKRVIFVDGCLASNGDKLENSVTIYKNTATKSQLAFFPTSFSGGESEDIYVHCVVNKCDQSGDQTCSEICTDIGGDDKGSVTLLSTTETVTSGKIVLKDVCGGSGNGGCEQLCSVSDDNRAVCGCVRGFQVDPDDSKMCKGVPVPNPSARTGNPSVEWYYIAIPVVAVVLIAVAILVARKVNEGKAKSYKMPDLADLDD